jgi:hypothetical protein
MDQPVRWAPVEILTNAEVSLRVKLGAEEQNEWLDSFQPLRNNKVAVDQIGALDALCDRLYILLGDVHALGFGLIFPTAFRRVHESNMSKLWTTLEKEMTEQTDTNLQFERADVSGERCWLCRNSFGKVMKSPSYIEAALGDLLDDLSGQELLSFDCAKKIIYGDAPEPDIEEVFAEFGKESDDEED